LDRSVGSLLKRLAEYTAQRGVASMTELAELAESLGYGGDELEDALLEGMELSILLPLESMDGTLEWSSLVVSESSRWHVPPVARELLAGRSWREAVESVMRRMGEEKASLVPELFEGLLKRGPVVSASEVAEEAVKLGFRSSEVSRLIAELKGAGLMSPRVKASIRAGEPTYRLSMAFKLLDLMSLKASERAEHAPHLTQPALLDKGSRPSSSRALAALM